MSQPLTIPEVPDELFAALQRRARQIGNGVKAEDVALGWLQDHVLTTRDLPAKFRDAARVVDRQLQRGELGSLGPARD